MKMKEIAVVTNNHPIVGERKPQLLFVARRDETGVSGGGHVDPSLA